MSGCIARIPIRAGTMLAFLPFLRAHLAISCILGMERCHFPVGRVRVPLLLALTVCFSCSSWPFASAAYQSLPKQSLLVAIVVFKRCWPFSLVFPAKNCGHGFGSAHCSSGKWGALLLSPFSDAKDFAFCSAFLGKEARRVRHAFLVISGPHFAPFSPPFRRRDLVLANPG